jgi:hypothetical protein
MNKSVFGEHTETMLSIAEMACNLDPETVNMRYIHSPFCNTEHCILGHAELREIIPCAHRFCSPTNWEKWFGARVTLTPKQIGYQILDWLEVEHL